MANIKVNRVTNGIGLLLVLLLITSSCKTHWAYSGSYKAQSIKMSDTLTQDDKVNQLILPYRASLDSVMHRPAGYIANELTKDKPESTLGNFMADAILTEYKTYNQTEADFAIVNYGGIRLPSLPSGNIEVGKMYELMPFDNKLVCLELNTSQIQQLFDAMAKAGGWPIAGASYTIENAKATQIIIQGEPLSDAKMYKAVMSDYIAGGGDKMDFLISIKPLGKDLLMRDALIHYLQTHSSKNVPYSSRIEGRVK